MALHCPNKSHPDYKKLVEKYGEAKANSLWNREITSDDRKVLSKTELLFQNQIKRLTTSLKLATTDSSKAKYKEELEYTKGQYIKYQTDKNKKEVELSYGNRLLSVVSDKIEQFEDGKFTPSNEDIVYIERVLDTFDDVVGLRDKVGELKQKVKLFQDTNLNNLIKEVNPEESLKDAENQNKDIGTFKMGTGSLLDLENIYANTIGKIIRSSQTKIERANKKFHKEIKDFVDNLEKTSGKSALDIFKEVIFTDIKNNKKSLNKYLKQEDVSEEAWKFYNFYKSKMKELMDITPVLTYRDNDGNLTTFELTEYFIPNVPKSELKDKIKGLNPIKTRKVGEFVKDEDDKSDIIPLNFIKSIPADKKSDDLGENLYLFAASMHNFDEMSKTLPKVRLLQKAIEDKKEGYIQASNPNSTKSGQDSNLWKIVDGFIRAQVKGEFKKQEGQYGFKTYKNENGDFVEDYVDITGTIDNLLRWNSLKRIGFSPIGAVANVLFGKLSNWIEAVGGQFFTRRDLRVADKIFTEQTFKEDSVLNKELLSKYNILQELTDYELAESAKSGKAKYLSPEKFTEYMYSMQKMGEKYIQSTSLLAMMLNDGFITSDGVLTDKWNKSTEEQKEAFILKVTGVNNRLHGRYSPKESAIWQQSVFYRAISQFRKYIPAAIESRFDSKHYNSRLGVEVEGRYRTFNREVLGKIIKGEFGNALYNTFMPLINAEKVLKSEKMTETEIANMRKMLIETVLLTGTLLLASVGMGGSDEDKKRRKNPAFKASMLLLNRISGDIAFFYSPEQLNNITKNAVPMAKLNKDLITLLTYSIWNPTEEFEGGNSKGMNKLGKKVLDITPGSNIGMDIFKILNKNPLDNIN